MGYSKFVNEQFGLNSVRRISCQLTNC